MQGMYMQFYLASISWYLVTGIFLGHNLGYLQAEVSCVDLHTKVWRGILKLCAKNSLDRTMI